MIATGVTTTWSLILEVRLLAPYFFSNSAKEVSKKAPLRHPDPHKKR